MITIKTPEEVGKMRVSGALLHQVLDALRKEVAPGVTTHHLDQMAERMIRDAGAVPSFKGFEGYKYTLCTSVDDHVVHGFPNKMPLKEGQLLSIDAGLVLAVIQAESSFDHTAVSPVGAQGAMQIMPHTQEELGLIDPFDPRANVYAGSQYLMHQLQRFGSVELALAAYNAGPGSVEQYGGIPPFPETQEFVRRVLVYWNRNIPADQPTHS